MVSNNIHHLGSKTIARMHYQGEIPYADISDLIYQMGKWIYHQFYGRIDARMPMVTCPVKENIPAMKFDSRYVAMPC